MAGVRVAFTVTSSGGMLSAIVVANPCTFKASKSSITALGEFFRRFLRQRQAGSPARQPALAQNAPNPFNSQTVLAYFLPAAGPVRLEVFSLTGQRVAVLRQGLQQAGYHWLRWDGRDDAGRSAASGMYLYRLVTDETVLTRKLTLLR